ncbi:hypothetical protein D7X55_16165 [Corallococcus sp. AB049A]|uniref:Uncharacterized protein n=1 Tax=Corallococcus interemptor TaxID=2316720 RepID=A0A3A8R1Z9_9BACT|nr:MULTISPECIES: hypothetical protein [Corallococcus]RKH74008.1 hypothetical protein D7X96_00085 [Corallococcus interemptor]RKI65591.1 hypothetical protein D7X55_16165 [Corallococcus sp. AB049A]
MKDVLTIQEAYAAMYEYLQALHSVSPSDELGGLLGSMSLLDDGTPADPAVWADWLIAVQKARQGAVDMRLKLTPK